MNRSLDSCCGHQRRAVRQPSVTETAFSFTSSTSANTSEPAEFEYIGRTGLTVIGPLTGQRYRFARTGARLQVDGRDSYGLATVPLLKRVRQ
jgi:hypothetical protein